jgi:hypothetical protein
MVIDHGKIHNCVLEGGGGEIIIIIIRVMQQ